MSRAIQYVPCARGCGESVAVPPPPFRGAARLVCAVCRRKRKALEKQRARGKQVTVAATAGGSFPAVMGYAKVAQETGDPMTTVRDMELRVLARIRKEHPDLLELYRNWVAEGSPRPVPEPEGLQLLAFEGELVTWSAFAVGLRELGLVAEAEEAEGFIEQCHLALAGEIRSRLAAMFSPGSRGRSPHRGVSREGAKGAKEIMKAKVNHA